MSGKKRVAYFYDPDDGNYCFSPSHNMRPWRVGMTHSLVSAYDLQQHMDVLQAADAYPEHYKVWHDDEYVDALMDVVRAPPTPEKRERFGLMWRHKDDQAAENPIFIGMTKYIAKYTGASLAAAVAISQGKHDIAINWSGGMHHAKKRKAFGFCYINDCVLAIYQLLQTFDRVLYVDIDLHHGDGVEQAFEYHDNVMTLSFHHSDQYSDGKRFFPCTGFSPKRFAGKGEGRGYALNFPFRKGASDAAYRQVFDDILQAAVLQFKPCAIVLQCGADTLAGDPIGSVAKYNLSLSGHAHCVAAVKGLNLPLLVLGGGGYNPVNVAKTWAFDTAVLCDVQLDTAIPDTCAYRETLGSTLEVRANPEVKDENDAEYLQDMREQVYSVLRQCKSEM